jgi:Na+(H+)/acetate symporter ActP
MQHIEFALSIIPTGCLLAMIAKFPCHAAVFTAFLRVLATPEVGQMVSTSWSSHKFFLILFFPFITGIIYTFQVCNFLKVNILKNEIKIHVV